MKPSPWWLILLCFLPVIFLLIVKENIREMKENWTEQQPPRFCDYFLAVIESIADIFS